MVCSIKKLKVGESSSWKKTGDCSTARWIWYIDEEKNPDSFYKVLSVSGLKLLVIPSCFLPYFDSECPETIKLKTSTGCIWDVDLKEQDGNIFIDAGWPEFVEAHDLKKGYFLVFKELDTRSLKVIVFGCNCYEKVIMCAGYHPSLEQYETLLY